MPSLFLLVDTSERCCSHISTSPSIKVGSFAIANFSSPQRLQPFLSAFLSASAHNKSPHTHPLITLGTVKYKYFPMPHPFGDAMSFKLFLSFPDLSPPCPGVRGVGMGVYIASCIKYPTQILVVLKLRLFDNMNPHVYWKMTKESTLRYDYEPFSSQ